MYCIEIPKLINNIMSLFYYLGLWHRGEKATVRETRIKLFYCLYQLLLPLSLLIGSIKSVNKDESIFLAELSIVGAILSIKLYYIIWRKEEIIEMLTRIGVYSMENREEFKVANNKLKKFQKFVIVLFFICLTSGYTATFASCFGKQKKLFLNIGFPLDWKNNEISFWLANAFLFTEITLSAIAISFPVINWYLMINCASRFEVLGCQIRNMGAIRTTNETSNKGKRSDVEKHNLFLQDLIAAIESHQDIRELTQNMISFISTIFFIQIVTSGLCICGSIYCLAFHIGETLVEHCFHVASLVYNLSDIFMIMYFGNEIKLSSDRLSYCLFESNWIDQPQATKKLIIIFGELLMQPHELVVGTLYPLTLETFRRILNFAYNTFNILKKLEI